MKRDLVIERRQRYLQRTASNTFVPCLQRIHESHQAYMPLAYPIVYQNGGPLSEHGQLHKNNSKKVSLREDFRFKMVNRIQPSDDNIQKLNSYYRKGKGKTNSTN